MRDAVQISLDEFIECCAKVGLSANEALARAREHGYRVDNNVFYAEYRKARAKWSSR